MLQAKTYLNSRCFNVESHHKLDQLTGTVRFTFYNFFLIFCFSPLQGIFYLRKNGILKLFERDFCTEDAWCYMDWISHINFFFSIDSLACHLCGH